MHVRWDAVVDRSLVTSEIAPAPVRRPGREPGGAVRAHVRLFGALASIGAKRAFELDLPGDAVVGDVVVRLARDLGEEFLSRVLDPAGSKHSYCRLFVDGVAVEDLRAPLEMTADPTQIEIILLMGLEGG